MNTIVLLIYVEQARPALEASTQQGIDGLLVIGLALWLFVLVT